MDFVDYTKKIKEKEMAKRILFLGAGVDQIPAIQYAKKKDIMSLHVIIYLITPVINYLMNITMLIRRIKKQF